MAALPAVGRPAVLVPLPIATDDHQAANTREIVAAGGARSIRQEKFTTSELAKQIQAIAMNVNPPEVPVLTAPVRTGESAQLAWSGGGGPFSVQSKPSVGDPWCAVGDVTPARTVTVAAKAATGFYRVADLAVGEAVSFSVVLSGAYERPVAIETTGTGSGTLAIQGNTLNFDIRYSGLSGPATLAHIHGPAGMEGTAGVMINLGHFLRSRVDVLPIEVTPDLQGWQDEGPPADSEQV